MNGIRRDLVIAVVFAVIAGASTYVRSSTLHPVVYTYGEEYGFDTSDLWFDGDMAKVILMTASRRTHQHSITSEHPFMPLFLYPIHAVSRLAGSTFVETTRAVWSVIAAFWAALLFLLLRRFGCRVPDAAVLTCVGISSAVVTFWFPVPEIFSVGSLTILIALYATLRGATTQPPSLGQLVMVNMVSMSMTISNWMTGIVATFLIAPRRRALLAIGGALTVASLIWGLERIVFPNARYFLTDSARLAEDMFVPDIARLGKVTRSFVAHTVVMPAITVIENADGAQALSVQGSDIGSASLWGKVSGVSWLLLVGLGAATSAAAWKRSTLMKVVVLSAGAQLTMHVIFGSETFLYAMHYLPFLLVIAASATLTRFRVPALILAACVAVAGGVNNQQQFAKATAFIESVGSKLPKPRP